ncbi:pseudouridine synthase [Geminisphaera colitermitum]|uniref:pseudouridine synthase n=1 Tax=Geminisphaera colitermitum TaxID=1148786 RepID=UPI001E2BEDBD|nr:pseudouridine synthase [Geminisphaera colitermitum]
MRRQRPNDRGQKPETRGRSPEVRKQKPEDGKNSATEVRPLAAGLWPLVSDILGPGVQLLTHDTNGLAALNKPAGILAHPNTPGDAPRSLLQARYHPDGEYYEWTKQKTEDASQPKSGLLRPLASGLSDSRETAPPPHRLWLLNRLDSGTSGVILVCADETLAREIRALFQRKQIHKIYHALVFGRPSQARQVWRDRLAVQKKGGHIRTGTGGNLPAETHMTVLRQQRDGPPPPCPAGTHSPHRTQPSTPRAMRATPPPHCRRRHLWKFRGQPRIWETTRHQTPLPAFARHELRLRMAGPHPHLSRHRPHPARIPPPPLYLSGDLWRADLPTRRRCEAPPIRKARLRRVWRKLAPGHCRFILSHAESRRTQREGNVIFLIYL